MKKKRLNVLYWFFFMYNQIILYHLSVLFLYICFIMLVLCFLMSHTDHTTTDFNTIFVVTTCYLWYRSYKLSIDTRTNLPNIKNVWFRNLRFFYFICFFYLSRSVFVWVVKVHKQINVKDFFFTNQFCAFINKWLINGVVVDWFNFIDKWFTDDYYWKWCDMCLS